MNSEERKVYQRAWVAKKRACRQPVDNSVDTVDRAVNKPVHRFVDNVDISIFDTKGRGVPVTGLG